MNAVTRALIVLVCAAAFNVEAQTKLDELKKQHYDTELAVEKSGYRVPDCSAAPDAELTTYIQGAAKRLGLATIAIQPAGTGHESPVRIDRIDLSGRGA